MSSKSPESPRILSVGWGKLEVEALGKGKDFKLWPGGGRAWDWNEFGTGHGRGIQPAELDELIDHGAKVIVLTRGVLSRLRVPEATSNYARDRQVELVIAATKKGVQIYNQYVEKNVAVGGLFHSTC